MGFARFAVISDTHLSTPGTADGRWNNVMRLSASHQILAAAVADIVAAGHDRVLLLGDISDLGDADMVIAALRALGDAGLQVWAVPGNHDVDTTPQILEQAMEGSAGGAALEAGCRHLLSNVVVCGHGLCGDDGGRTYVATGLPDVATIAGRLLLCAQHYPVLSQENRLARQGLQYPGDLVNREELHATLSRFEGPVLVLHGHLHAAVVDQSEQMLQIGVPAAVEWPHAWTDASVEVNDDNVAVRTRLRSIPGAWSSDDLDTVLDDPRQSWTFRSGRWSRSTSAPGGP